MKPPHALLLGLVVLGCSSPSAGPAPSSSAIAAAASASASADVNVAPLADGMAPVVFAGGALELHELKLKIGRDKDPRPRDVIVTATAKVSQQGEGRVELPLRYACRFREKRVVGFTRLISSASERVSLEKVKNTELYSRSPSQVGWLGRADACELTVRREPIGTAKGGLAASEETLCWTPAGIARGACSFVPLTPSSARFALHGVDWVDGSEFRAHLQTKTADPPRSAVFFEATCGDKKAREMDLLPTADPFHVAPGESLPVHVRFFRNEDLPSGKCTVRAKVGSWDNTDSPTPSEEVDLGTWCVGGVIVLDGGCE